MGPLWDARGRVSTGDRPSHAAVAVLILVGVAVLAHPLYLWPHYQQVPYSMHGVEQVSGETPADGSVVPYADLPETARSAFEAALDGEYLLLWSGEVDRAVRVLRDHRFIRHDGAIYRFSLTHGDRSELFTGLVRGLLTAAGAFLIAFGALVGYAGSWRPLTPVRALFVFVVVVVGLVATSAYDVVYSGVRGSVWPPPGLAVFVHVGVPLLPAGSVLRRRGVASLGRWIGLGSVLMVGGTIVTGAPPVVPAALAVIVGISGAPWLLLGYVLTASE